MEYLVIALNVSANSQEERTMKSPIELYIASLTYILNNKNLDKKSSKWELEIGIQ